MENNIKFPALIFDKPGVYSYVMKELSPSSGDWITDRREYRVIITVKEKLGELVARVDYPDGDPVFVNKYCHKPRPKENCFIICCCDCICHCFCWCCCCDEHERGDSHD